MSHARCLAQHVSTGLTKGQRRADGSFYRCLRREDVKRVFRDDDTAEYGYRVRPEKWTGWSDSDQESGLSVTEAVCAKYAECAIHLHPNAEKFRHAVRIDLAALSREIGFSLSALFDPVTDAPENPCHFVIVPDEVSIDVVMVALEAFLAKEFPPSPKTQPKKPSAAVDIARVKAAKARYDSVFAILLDVASAPAACS